jgi:hypothetical protein
MDEAVVVSDSSVASVDTVAVTTNLMKVNGSNEVLKKQVCGEYTIDLDQLVSCFKRLTTINSFPDIKSPQGVYSWLAKILGIKSDYHDANEKVRKLLNEWGK